MNKVIRAIKTAHHVLNHCDTEDRCRVVWYTNTDVS